jgi:hypothetical protein
LVVDLVTQDYLAAQNVLQDLEDLVLPDQDLHKERNLRHQE